MSDNSFSPIAIIGTGTTGASWAAYYLARGLEVVAIDPLPPPSSRSVRRS